MSEIGPVIAVAAGPGAVAPPDAALLTGGDRFAGLLLAAGPVAANGVPGASAAEPAGDVPALLPLPAGVPTLLLPDRGEQVPAMLRARIDGLDGPAVAAASAEVERREAGPEHLGGARADREGGAVVSDTTKVTAADPSPDVVPVLILAAVPALPLPVATALVDAPPLPAGPAADARKLPWLPAAVTLAAALPAGAPWDRMGGAAGVDPVRSSLLDISRPAASPDRPAPPASVFVPDAGLAVAAIERAAARPDGSAVDNRPLITVEDGTDRGSTAASACGGQASAERAPVRQPLPTISAAALVETPARQLAGLPDALLPRSGGGMEVPRPRTPRPMVLPPGDGQIAVGLPSAAVPAPDSAAAPTGARLAAALPAAAPRISVNSDRLGHVDVAVDGGGDDVQVTLGLTPGAAVQVSADAPRLSAELAAHGHRLQSLQFDLGSGGSGARPDRGPPPPPMPPRTLLTGDAGPAPATTADRYA